MDNMGQATGRASMNTIKIGIIGTGNTVSIGANHALALSQMQDVQLVGIYNRSPVTSLAQPNHLTGDNPASEWNKPYQ